MWETCLSEWTLRGEGKEIGKGRPYSVIIYTLYHAIEIKMKLNKKKEHLWEVPT